MYLGGGGGGTLQKNIYYAFGLSNKKNASSHKTPQSTPIQHRHIQSTDKPTCTYIHTHTDIHTHIYNTDTYTHLTHILHALKSHSKEQAGFGTSSNRCLNARTAGRNFGTLSEQVHIIQ